jgi:hypothetical protein
VLPALVGRAQQVQAPQPPQLPQQRLKPPAVQVVSRGGQVQGAVLDGRGAAVQPGEEALRAQQRARARAALAGVAV